MSISRTKRALLLALSPLAIVAVFIGVSVLQAHFIDEMYAGVQTIVNLVMMGPLVLLLPISAVVLSFTTGADNLKVGPWTRSVSVLSLLLTIAWAILAVQVYTT